MKQFNGIITEEQKTLTRKRDPRMKLYGREK